MSTDRPVILQSFRKRDPLTGKWYRARWKASAEEIESQGGDWIADGPPAIYPSLGVTSGFQPNLPAPIDVPLLLHPQRQSPPALDSAEHFLSCLFLRRYVTYCMRRGRYGQAEGAARLHGELAQLAFPFRTACT